MVFKNICDLVLLKKVVSALKGLMIGTSEIEEACNDMDQHKFTRYIVFLQALHGLAAHRYLSQ